MSTPSPTQPLPPAHPLPEQQPNPRALILAEVLRGESSLRAYNNVCRVTGPMSATEFRFWYRRFKVGKHDLDHDKSQDPSLQQLPFEILQHIVGYITSEGTRHMARASSVWLRNIIDTTKFKERIYSFVLADRSSVLYTHGSVQFYSLEDGCRITRSGDYPGLVISQVKDSLLMAAMKEFIFKMRQPKLEMQKLNIQFEFQNEDSRTTCAKYFKSSLKTLENQIQAKHLRVIAYDTEPVLDTICALKPGFLEKIELIGVRRDADSEDFLRKLVHTEQWRRAIDVDLKRFAFQTIPFNTFMNLKRFQIEVESFTVGDLDDLKMVLRSPQFEYCEIESTKYAFPRVDELELDVVFRNWIKHRRRNVWTTPITETKYSFRFLFKQQSLKVRKISENVDDNWFPHFRF